MKLINVNLEKLTIEDIRFTGEGFKDLKLYKIRPYIHDVVTTTLNFDFSRGKEEHSYSWGLDVTNECDFIEITNPILIYEYPIKDRFYMVHCTDFQYYHLMRHFLIENYIPSKEIFDEKKSKTKIWFYDLTHTIGFNIGCFGGGQWYYVSCLMNWIALHAGQSVFIKTQFDNNPIEFRYVRQDRRVRYLSKLLKHSSNENIMICNVNDIGYESVMGSISNLASDHKERHKIYDVSCKVHETLERYEKQFQELLKQNLVLQSRNGLL